MKRFIFILTAATFMTGWQMSAQSPFDKIKEKREAYEYLPLCNIKPTGQIKAQMQKDLEGFVGNLDKLVPDLITNDDIYGKDRLTKNAKPKNLGNNPDGAEWEVQYFWWNSETQSNWWDGYIRNAFFVNDTEEIKKIRKHIYYILSTQDEDGYLGIYQPDLRYNFNGENGELWAKASLYRTLLAYYGFTKDPAVLKAVGRAVQNVMDNYKINASNPFKIKSSFEGGLCHGLVFTDILDQLYQLTGNSIYWDYTLFLYKDYSSHEIMEKDVQYPSIMDKEYLLQGHGVHTYEHLRPLSVAVYASGNPQLENALKIYLERIAGVTTVSGGPIGDEWIVKRKADPTYTGYEYCSLHELLDSYGQLFQKSGNIAFANEMETIFFNAAMGARHPERSCIAYLKTDNSYAMTGGAYGTKGPDHKQTRYKYSPVHQDVAVCCVPNAGRITPYYVQNMWLKDKEGLIASLFGSCEVNTLIGGQIVSVREITEYPYQNQIRFEVETSQPVEFTIKIRKPAWAKGFTLDTEYQEKDGYIIVRKQWNGKNTLVLDWKADIEKNFFNNEVYFTYGPLVLAAPIEAEEYPKREYLPGFQDFEYAPKSLIIYQVNKKEMPVETGDNKFSIKLYNPKTKKEETRFLVPIGQTILRQMTFKER